MSGRWTLAVFDANGGLKTATSGTVVTSVGLSTDASYLTVGSTPVTTSGTITINKTGSLPANKLVATPTTGTGTADLRLLDPADLVAGGMTPSLGTATFSYEVTSGTNGGTYTTGGRATRPINTTRYNTITGASLGSNRVTLPVGTYRISWHTQSFAVNGVSMILRNITDGVDEKVGLSNFSAGGTAPVDNPTDDLLVVSGSSKAFELQMSAGATRNNDGQGTAASQSVAECYLIFKVEKVA